MIHNAFFPASAELWAIRMMTYMSKTRMRRLIMPVAMRDILSTLGIVP
jgi:hypothetical protein